MNALPYEKAAMHGDEMPDGLDYPDQVMFLALRLMYNAYRRKIITADQGAQEKKKLMDEYRCYKFHWENGERWTQVLKATEAARCAYRKDRTLESADKIVTALENMQ